MAIEKAAGTWTVEDLYALPDDKHYEIVEGELYEMPPPNADHVRLVMSFIRLLLPWADRIGGELRTAPQGVFLPGLTNPVQSDLLLLTASRRRTVAEGGLLTERGVVGPPELVIEVLSPSNREHDLARKRRIYALGGVPEYWLVDPQSRSIEVLVLAGAEYRIRVRPAGEETATSAVLPELAFRASEVFA